MFSILAFPCLVGIVLLHWHIPTNEAASLRGADKMGKILQAAMSSPSKSTAMSASPIKLAQSVGGRAVPKAMPSTRGASKAIAGQNGLSKQAQAAMRNVRGGGMMMARPNLSAPNFLSPTRQMHTQPTAAAAGVAKAMGNLKMDAVQDDALVAFLNGRFDTFCEGHKSDLFSICEEEGVYSPKHLEGKFADQKEYLRQKYEAHLGALYLAKTKWHSFESIAMKEGQTYEQWEIATRAKEGELQKNANLLASQLPLDPNVSEWKVINELRERLGKLRNERFHRYANILYDCLIEMDMQKTANSAQRPPQNGGRGQGTVVPQFNLGEGSVLTMVEAMYWLKHNFDHFFGTGTSYAELRLLNVKQLEGAKSAEKRRQIESHRKAFDQKMERMLAKAMDEGAKEKAELDEMEAQMEADRKAKDEALDDEAWAKITVDAVRAEDPARDQLIWRFSANNHKFGVLLNSKSAFP